VQTAVSPLIATAARDDARRLLRHTGGELFALAAKLVRREVLHVILTYS
jgi:hypothetical protein